MLHFRGEVQEVKFGFNFYPWRERASSLGFVFNAGRLYWTFRYSTRIGRLFNYVEMAK